MRIKNIFLVSVFCLFQAFCRRYSQKRRDDAGRYFDIVFFWIISVVNQEANAVVVKYSGISGRYALRSALQRGIYYGMIPNTSTELDPDRPMTDHAFALLLKNISVSRFALTSLHWHSSTIRALWVVSVCRTRISSSKSWTRVSWRA